MKTFNKAMDKKFHSGRAAAKVLQTKNKKIRDDLKKLSEAIKSHLQYTLDKAGDCNMWKIMIWRNGPAHWKGDHTMCKHYNPDAPCVLDPARNKKVAAFEDPAVFKAVEEWIQLPAHEKLLENLEHGMATSIVESFNNMAAAWADKRKFYGTTAIALRHNLAVLHWNNNRGRKFLGTRKNKVSEISNKHKKRTERRYYDKMSFTWARDAIRDFCTLCGGLKTNFATSCQTDLTTHCATVLLL